MGGVYAASQNRSLYQARRQDRSSDWNDTGTRPGR